MSGPTLLSSCIGDYRLTDFLGAGGMGEVYRGVHAKLGRVVAIKLLQRNVSDPSFLERFLNEARIQASLQHANIATLYDFLEYNGQPCIIMEFVEGQTLTERIAACGCLTVPEAMKIFGEVLSALDYIHARGIVHRDIKSNNIKISQSGQVKLLDFGIAKSGSSPALTATGGFIGTLQYLSPEQLKGGIADARSDIWALGVLLYEMVTGAVPFQAATLGELYEKISAVKYTPPSIINPDLPREVQAITGRCLKKNPRDRYQSIRELTRDVEQAPAELLAAPPVPSAGPRLDEGGIAEPAPVEAPGSAAWKWVAGGVLGFLLLVAALAVGLYTMVGDGGGAEKPAAHRNARTFTIDCGEGSAEVHIDGEIAGSTPYTFEGMPGDSVEFVLKKAGFADKRVALTLSDNKKVYTFVLERD